MSKLSRKKVLDLYFMDARHKLIDLAAFLDRLDRAEGKVIFDLKRLLKLCNICSPMIPTGPPRC